MNQSRLHKVFSWIACISIAVPLILFWREMIFLFFFFVVGTVELFFEQDYRPWKDSMLYLAVTRQEFDARTDSAGIEALVNTSGEVTSRDCLAFTRELQEGDLIRIPGNTYCKIRVVTPCECSPNDDWVKIQVSRGREAGKSV